MIIGAHTVLYSSNPNADRDFLRDVLGLASVDAGGGFLIFSVPPAEISVHQAGEPDTHELYLLCDDVRELTQDLAKRGVRSSAVKDAGWGLVTQLTLPSGAKLGVYEPRHARPSQK
jgi:catechol 2,3-dioxygenase-like lactoylglutathione lyase family enzyme